MWNYRVWIGIYWKWNMGYLKVYDEIYIVRWWYVYIRPKYKQMRLKKKKKIGSRYELRRLDLVQNNETLNVTPTVNTSDCSYFWYLPKWDCNGTPAILRMIIMVSKTIIRSEWWSVSAKFCFRVPCAICSFQFTGTQCWQVGFEWLPTWKQ